MTIEDTARDFFEACETGQGWDSCRNYCHGGATFSCQSDALADVNTLEGYTEWMKGLLVPVSDGHYELAAFASDDYRGVVVAFAVFHGTHKGDGGPVPATGKAIVADYVYAMEFDSSKIRHMTKIWNDGYSLQQLGWA
ncbi:MAG: polyketide cyclase [Sneathiella sp.]|uniref:ester cyclase n=1 Tax=Sneathiella sp. TaxID=1964365 RepID=UPI000C51EFB2|nr:ester cyclase [Sneathiella sp.]MAZ01668.1 polyketide cyclase [Sneathiella sp.]